MPKHSDIFTYPTDSLQEISQNWSNELRLASQGLSTSLVFAKHKVTKPIDSVFDGLVMVIGGSNLVVSRVSRRNGKIEILSYQKSPLPKLSSKQILFELVEKQIPDNISKIALNFAYPLSPTQNEQVLDGILIASSKEHSFDGLIGEQVGLQLEKYLKGKLKKDFKIAVANDTVCLVLAGLSKSQSENLIGGIVGTGFNFGLFIDDSVVVNLESANFDKFEQTDTGKQICANSLDPKKGIYEKEISGAYLYQHYNLIAEQTGWQKVSSTQELSMLASQNSEQAKIAQKLLQRSASLVAAHITGICLFKQNQNLNIIMEGSLFWNGWNYKNLVYDELAKLGITIGKLEIFKLERSYILGAAELII